MIAPQIQLRPGYDKRIGAELDVLLRETDIRYCVIMDRHGLMLAHREASWAPKPPAYDVIGSLVASNAASINALGELLGDGAMSEQIHKGEKGVVYIESVGTKCLLFMIFDVSVSTGHVRVMAKKTIKTLEEMLEKMEAEPMPKLEANFNMEANSLLDAVLGSLND